MFNNYSGIFKMKMMSSQVVFTLILISIDLALGSVPLLLLGSVKSKEVGKHSGLLKTKTEEFKQYLSDKVSRSKYLTKVIVFLEDDLSVEDFSWKDKNNLGHYPRLKDVIDTAPFSDFFPSVNLPLEAVQGLDRYSYVLRYFEGTDSLPTEDQWNIIWIIRLIDLEDRTNSLLSHDKILVDVYHKLSKIYYEVLVLYTGIKSSWEPQMKLQRHRTNANRRLLDDDEYGVLSCRKNIIYSSKHAVLNSANELIKLTTEESVQSDWELKGIFKVYSSICGVEHSSKGVVLKWVFNHTSSYWKLEFIVMNKTFDKALTYLFPLFEITAPIGRSWHSSLEVVFISNTTENGYNTRTKLTFVNLQVEHFLKFQQDMMFSPAVDVITFFTIHIAEALFVVWLLLMILMFGILMLMDIKTNDQFDDINGKRLMFNTDE